MHSFNGRYVMVFNGEIYNYIELRTELEKEGFFSTDEATLKSLKGTKKAKVENAI